MIFYQRMYFRRKKMKKLFLLSFLLFSFSCEDNREESLEPSMQLWVNGDYINPYTYYKQINTYGEKKIGDDGKIKKLFVLHLQREIGRVSQKKNYIYFK